MKISLFWLKFFLLKLRSAPLIYHWSNFVFTPNVAQSDFEFATRDAPIVFLFADGKFDKAESDLHYL